MRKIPEQENLMIKAAVSVGMEGGEDPNKEHFRLKKCSLKNRVNFWDMKEVGREMEQTNREENVEVIRDEENTKERKCHNIRVLVLRG